MSKADITKATQAYLESSYAELAPDYPPLKRFQNEICDTMEIHGICRSDSILDVGCGRGYLLKALEDRGYTNVQGIDPCPGLVQNAVSSHVREGAFFDPQFEKHAFDVVVCCHTLHHLESPRPLQELDWMRSIARKCIVIVEVNNTNIPTLLMGLVHKKTEPHVSIYNKGYVEKLFTGLRIPIAYSGYMRPGYLSGDSLPHTIAAWCGMPPYSVVIGLAEPVPEVPNAI